MFISEKSSKVQDLYNEYVELKMELYEKNELVSYTLYREFDEEVIKNAKEDLKNTVKRFKSVVKNLNECGVKEVDLLLLSANIDPKNY